MHEKCLDLPYQKDKPLSAKYIRSYSFYSMEKRLPDSLKKLIDQVAADEKTFVAKYGEGAKEDVKNVLSKLSALKDEVTTNQPFRDIISDKPDVKIWNDERARRTAADGAPPTWYETDWLYAECYGQRRIKEAFEHTTHLQDYDPFLAWKIKSFIQSKPAIISLGQHLDSILKKINTLTQEDTKKFLTLYLKASMWSNRCDLSLSGGDSVSPDNDILEQTEKLDKNILVDQSELVWDILTKKKDYKILDIILDNAGYELFSDLVLADYLVSSKLVNKIRFHPKLQPWFVSDVTFPDFDYVLNAVSNDLEDSALNDLGKKWRSYVNSGIWSLEAEPSWTYFYGFDAIKEKDPKLYSKLGEGIIAIFKGDMNYRKLMNDILWDPTTPFHKALMSFHPTSILSLRTIKCHTICGLKPGVAENLDKTEPNWIITGDYGLVQFDPADE